MRPWVIAVVALAQAPVARAGDDPDLEIAQRRFTKGSQYYVAKDYARAIEEFEAARRVMPAPEIDYNIARCHDRLEHFREAIAAYERYLASKPSKEDAAEVEARLKVLQPRVPRVIDQPPKEI